MAKQLGTWSRESQYKSCKQALLLPSTDHLESVQQMALGKVGR